MTTSEIERQTFVELDRLSSFEWSHRLTDRSIYNSLTEYQEVRRREFVHLLAVKLGIMK